MSLIELVLRIFTYNAMTFGNGPAMIPMLQKDLVDTRGILTLDQLLYAFAVARITPGQANVYVASIGYMLFGLFGAVLSTLAIQLPGYLMLPLLSGYERFKNQKSVTYFTRGLTSASVGLILAATLSIARRSLSEPVAWVVFGITVVMVQFFKWNPILSLLIASAIGVVGKILLG